jgi:hypothetical protein
VQVFVCEKEAASFEEEVASFEGEEGLGLKELESEDLVPFFDF